jgi:hypothetical protein
LISLSLCLCLCLQEDIGADIPSIAFNKLPFEKIKIEKGVMFATYSSLISGSGKTKKKMTRFDQLVEWCGGAEFDGCLFFDECHRAKNFHTGKQSTRTGTAVYNLQEALPKARIIYCSATGVTDPVNMGYMTRLGLWGVGTPFATFLDFLRVVENTIGMMELAVSSVCLSICLP